MASVSATIRIRDAERFRLFVWELKQAAEAMCWEDAQKVNAAVDRFLDGGDDEHEAEPLDT